MPFTKGHKLGIGNKYKLGIPPWNKGLKGIHLSPKSEFKKGQRPVNYKGGLSFYHGRWIIICRGDKKYPYARAVMECYLKKELNETDIVHHINENTADDRIENLELTNRREHINIHREKLETARGIR